MRRDGKFTRLSKSKITIMREAKTAGYSLSEIASSLSVAKSTVSLYCRDLYSHPNRVYETEEEARLAIYLRSLDKDHTKKQNCIDCGKIIRNEHTRCLKCNLEYQLNTGELEKFINSGIPTRRKASQLPKL